MWGISKSLKSLNNPQVLISKNQTGQKRENKTIIKPITSSKRPKTFLN